MLACYLKIMPSLNAAFWSAQKREFYCTSRTRGLGSQRNIERMTLRKNKNLLGFDMALARYHHHCNQLYITVNQELYNTENAWDIIACNNIKQAFSRVATASSGDAIGRNNIDPNATAMIIFK